MKRQLLTSSIIAMMGLGYATSAYAQIDEIIVTAQKKQEGLQTVPISVTAFSAEDLRESGFTNSIDIAQQVVGLNIGTPIGEGNNPSITLRGVGLNDFNDNNEGPVSVYNDGVYVAALPAQTFQIFDLERVEVLRGPQGTLFGRNATGGLIQFVSKKPTKDPEASIALTLGSFDQVKTEAAVSGPLTESIQGRISLTTNNHDGYVENTLGPDGNESDSVAVRGQLNFEIGDRGNFLLRGDYAQLDVAAGRIAQEATGSIFNDPSLFPQFADAPLVDAFGFSDLDGDPFTVAQDREGNVLDVETTSLSGTLDYDLTDNLALTSITAYSETERLYQEDSDVGPFPGLIADFGVESDQFSQELRLSGDQDRFSWQAGVFYFESTVENESEVFLNQPVEFIDFLDDLPGDAGGFEGGLSFFLNDGNEFITGGLGQNTGAPNIAASINPITVDPSLGTIPLSGQLIPFLEFDVDYRQKTESYAIFGEFNFDLTDKFTFTGGLRYTDDSREIEYINRAPAGSVFNDFFSIPGLAADGVSDIFSGDLGSTAGNFFDFTSEGLAARGLGDLNNIDDDAITGRAVLEYQATDDVLLYASYNRGFKSAGFNTGFLDSSDLVTVDQVAYDSETINAYEVGFKSTLLDNRLRLNAGAFYYDYNDFQALTFQGLSQFITNAEAVFYGGEAEVTAIVAEGLEANFAVSFLDTDVDGVLAGTGEVLNNVEAALAPNVSANGSISYEKPAFGGKVKGTVDVTYNGSQFFDITNNDLSDEDGYALVNLRAAYTGGDDDQYEFAVFVNNVTDTEYRVYSFDFTGGIGVNQEFFGRPRWWGGSLTYNF